MSVQLKKEYSEFRRAIYPSIKDNEPINDWAWGLGTTEFFSTYFQSYLKIEKLCKQNDIYCLYKEGASPWTYLNGRPTGVAVATSFAG